MTRPGDHDDARDGLIDRDPHRGAAFRFRGLCGGLQLGTGLRGEPAAPPDGDLVTLHHTGDAAAVVVDEVAIFRGDHCALEVRTDLLIGYPAVRPAPVLVAVHAGACDAPGLGSHEGGAGGVDRDHERDARQEEQLQGQASQEQPQQPASKGPHAWTYCPESWVCSVSSRVKRKRETTTIWSANAALARQLAIGNRSAKDRNRWGKQCCEIGRPVWFSHG